jgi:hypothetical protein
MAAAGQLWAMANGELVQINSAKGGRMKYLAFLTAVLTVLCLGAPTVRAQLLFSYEPGEPGLPYIGNPGTYTVTTSTTTGVTNGTQSITATIGGAAFGGPQSASMDPTTNSAVLAKTLALNTAPAVLIDMTVPNKQFNFGNIDLSFFQTGIRGPGLDADETGFSSTFATSPGQTITLQIPLTNTQFGTPHLTLDPTKPWAYQIDLSFGVPAGQGPYTFAFDNLRVVPEPASALALCAGGGLMFLRRRRV